LKAIDLARAMMSKKEQQRAANYQYFEHGGANPSLSAITAEISKD
jgi:hypothetical protein